jgi:hypothetical protein
MLIPGVKVFEWLAFLVQRIGLFFYIFAVMAIIYGSAVLFVFIPVFILLLLLALFFMRFVNATYPMLHEFCFRKHYKKEARKYLIRRSPQEKKVDLVFAGLLFKILVYLFCGLVMLYFSTEWLINIFQYGEKDSRMHVFGFSIFTCGFLLTYYCLLSLYAAFFIRKYKVEELDRVFY